MSILTRPRPPRPDVPPDAEAPEALIEEARRRARRRRRWYGACALVATAAGLLGFYGFNHGGDATSAQDGGGPASGQATNVFAQVRGWIVYTDEFATGGGMAADEYGIWAVDPTRPAGQASDRLQLRHLRGGGGLHFVEGSAALETAAVPLDWSDDGTKLLFAEPNPRPWWPRRDTGDTAKPRWWRLVILNADGTETTVLNGRRIWFWRHASLSPDGSQVVYANWRWISRSEGLRVEGIYIIDTDGGRPRLLRKAGRTQVARDRWARTGFYDPVFSPDGSKIAYIAGGGDVENGLRVMDADGSHVRVLVESDGKLSNGILPHCGSAGIGGAPAWSPDGSRLAFCGPGGIWVIGAEGSGLRKLIPNGVNPSWSPDGSRIAYQVRKGEWGSPAGPLRIADADGGNVQEFTWGNSGPWNPLEPAGG
jgi:Tol biopolymer transport system component